MMVKIEDGYSLSEKEIDNRIDECDVLFSFHHEEMTIQRADIIVMNIIKMVEKINSVVLHTYRYEPDGITIFLVKFPQGSDENLAMSRIMRILSRVRGVRGTERIN